MQRIELGAIVVREGRLLLTREPAGGQWQLPGGPFLPRHADTESAMEELLAALGISVPAIEDDFLDTLFFREEGGTIVYNLYAPSSWSGEPSAGAETGLGWFDPGDLQAVAMDERLRDAVLEAFGLRQPAPNDATILAELTALMAGELETRATAATAPPPGGRLDAASRALVVVASAAASANRALLEAAAADAVAAGWTPAQVAQAARLAAATAGTEEVTGQ